MGETSLSVQLNFFHRSIAWQQAKLTKLTPTEVVIEVSDSWSGMVLSRFDQIEEIIHKWSGNKPKLHVEPVDVISGSTHGYFTDGVWAISQILTAILEKTN